MKSELNILALEDVKFAMLDLIGSDVYDHNSMNQYLIINNNFDLEVGHNLINNKYMINNCFNYIAVSRNIAANETGYSLTKRDIDEYIEDNKKDILNQLDIVNNLIWRMLEVVNNNNSKFFYIEELNKMVYKGKFLYIVNNDIKHDKPTISTSFDSINIENGVLYLEGLEVVNILKVKGTTNIYLFDVDTDYHYIVSDII